MKVIAKWLTFTFPLPLSSKISCIHNKHTLSMMYFTDLNPPYLTGAVAEAFSVSGIEFVLAGVCFTMSGILILPSLFNRCRYQRSEILYRKGEF